MDRVIQPQSAASNLKSKAILRRCLLNKWKIIGDFFCFICFHDFFCGWQPMYLYERGNRNWSPWRNKIVYIWTLEHLAVDRTVENIIKTANRYCGQCKRKRNNNLLHLIVERRMQAFFHNDYTFHNFHIKIKLMGALLPKEIMFGFNNFKMKWKKTTKKSHTWATLFGMGQRAKNCPTKS